jgi:hypothetical protein
VPGKLFINRLTRADNIFEIDFFIMPIPIYEKHNRPYLPYVLLAVDSESQYVFCHDLLPPLPSLEEMWGLVPGKIVSLLGKMEGLPKEIRV